VEDATIILIRSWMQGDQVVNKLQWHRNVREMIERTRMRGHEKYWPHVVFQNMFNSLQKKEICFKKKHRKAHYDAIMYLTSMLGPVWSWILTQSCNPHGCWEFSSNSLCIHIDRQGLGPSKTRPQEWICLQFQT